MNRTTLFIVALFVSSVLHAEEPPTKESDVKDTFSGITSSVISFGKNMVSGVSSGVTDGRKEGIATDGAVIVSSREEFEQHVEGKLLRIYPVEQDQAVGTTTDENQELIAEFAFKNAGESPVRIVNLKDRGTLLVIDKDGYSYNLPSTGRNPEEVTVPERAAIKAQFVFSGSADQMSTVRLWGKEFTR